MESINSFGPDEYKLKAVLFDFDGTISTLRNGWEGIMEPLMIEMIIGDLGALKTGHTEGYSKYYSIVNEVREYINQSTGIQTYYQMEWLVKAINKHGENIGASNDPWEYKAEYNKRLMGLVDRRIESIKAGEKKVTDYLVKGAKEFLDVFLNRGIDMYVASGTDDPDVKNEAGILGLKDYFKEISGAPLGKIGCSKETVLKKLFNDYNLKGKELAVIGDGKVEIALGREFGAMTLGVASNEETGQGINQKKRKRLINAGCHGLVGDFCHLDEILAWMHIDGH